jgi:hypothetical protein
MVAADVCKRTLDPRPGAAAPGPRRPRAVEQINPYYVLSAWEVASGREIALRYTGRVWDASQPAISATSARPAITF